MPPEDLDALREHNSLQLSRMHPAAAGLVLSLLDEISRAGRNTWIRLEDPEPGGNSVGYVLVEGDADMIPLAARSLGFKSWEDGRLEAYGG